MKKKPLCSWCDEPVLKGESAIPRGKRRIHWECVVRMIAGSVGHQLKACGCFGGQHDDPEGMSKREAARVAAKLFMSNGVEGRT